MNTPRTLSPRGQTGPAQVRAAFSAIPDVP